jgi:hypothetical protein
MEGRNRLPEANQLSLVTGVILLAYAVSQYLIVPTRPLGLQLPGIYIPVDFQFRNLVYVTVAVLAAAGMDWIIEKHPGFQPETRLQHWLLPALTAWVIGIPLGSVAAGPAWWGVFLFGGALMVGVLVAEYITVDPADPRSTPAAVGLSVLALVLFTLLAVSIRLSGARLYVVAFAIGVGGMLACLRVYHLRLGARWNVSWSAGVSLLLVQVATGLHYLPVSPLQFGLILAGLMYALLLVTENLIQGHFVPGDLLEPGIIFTLIVIFALIVG